MRRTGETFRRMDETIELTCNDCAFSRTVEPDDDAVPAEVLIEHGRERGHTLTIDVLD